jgi:hypothetical protein
MNAEEIKMGKALKIRGLEPLKPMIMPKPDKFLNAYLYAIFISPLFLTIYFLIAR